MTPENLIQNAIAPALRLLPPRMDSPAAIAQLTAIALQESGIEHRRQVGGPARSYWQLEHAGGVRGVLTHPATRAPIQVVLTALDYQDMDAEGCWNAIEHNDILAAAFARLLLWTLPQPLPAQNAPAVAWAQYLQVWRPGRPHRESWDAFYTEAWDLAAIA